MYQRQGILPVGEARNRRRRMQIAGGDRNRHAGDTGARLGDRSGIGPPAARLAELVGDTQLFGSVN